MATYRLALSEHKIATLAGVREHNEGDMVELWIISCGRAVVRAYNECHNNYTDVDLVELLDWAKVYNNGAIGGPAIPACSDT